MLRTFFYERLTKKCRNTRRVPFVHGKRFKSSNIASSLVKRLRRHNSDIACWATAKCLTPIVQILDRSVTKSISGHGESFTSNLKLNRQKGCFSELANSLEVTVNFSLHVCSIGSRLPKTLSNGIIKLLLYRKNNSRYFESVKLTNIHQSKKKFLIQPATNLSQVPDLNEF